METITIVEVEMETSGEVLWCPDDPEDERSDISLVVLGDAKDSFEMSIQEAAEKFGASELFVEQIIKAFNYFAEYVATDLKSIWKRLDEIEGKK